jgi:hypothetical protein
VIATGLNTRNFIDRREARSILPERLLLLLELFEVNLRQLGRVISLLSMLSVVVYRFARTSREQHWRSAAFVSV